MTKLLISVLIGAGLVAGAMNMSTQLDPIAATDMELVDDAPDDEDKSESLWSIVASVSPSAWTGSSVQIQHSRTKDRDREGPRPRPPRV